jgi:hypothetical protein
VSARTLKAPRPSGEREGPAKREGEGAASEASLIPLYCPNGATPSPDDFVVTLSPWGRVLLGDGYSK